MTTAILPTFISQLVGITYAPTALGLIQGTSDAAATIMKLLSGFLVDRVTYYKPFLIIGYGATSIVGLIGFATSIWSVLLFKIIAWMARGIREPMRDTWLSKTISSKYYGRAFGFQRAFDTLGALLGPVSAFFLLTFQIPLQTIFFISMVPGLISMLPIIFLTQETKETTSKKLSNDIVQTIKKFPPKFNYFLLSMSLFGIANFNQALLLYRAQEALNNESTTFIMTTSWALLLYSLFNLIRGISEFGIGILSDYSNRKNILAILGFGIFTMVCIGCMSTTTNIWFWIILFAFAGLSAGTVKTLEKAHAADLLPESIRGNGFGVLQAIDGIGDLLSSIIVGGLWSLFSAQIAFIYAIAISFIAMIVLLKKQ